MICVPVSCRHPRAGGGGKERLEAFPRLVYLFLKGLSLDCIASSRELRIDLAACLKAARRHRNPPEPAEFSPGDNGGWLVRIGGIVRHSRRAGCHVALLKGLSAPRPFLPPSPCLACDPPSGVISKATQFARRFDPPLRRVICKSVFNWGEFFLAAAKDPSSFPFYLERDAFVRIIATGESGELSNLA